jgi:hypothetical protein
MGYRELSDTEAADIITYLRMILRVRGQSGKKSLRLNRDRLWQRSMTHPKTNEYTELLRTILIGEFGMSGPEADSLIHNHPGIVLNGMLGGKASVRACAMALDEATGKDQGHVSYPTGNRSTDRLLAELDRRMSNEDESISQDSKDRLRRMRPALRVLARSDPEGFEKTLRQIFAGFS